MEVSFKQDINKSKEEKYKQFIEQYSLLIEGEKDEVSVLANTSAALKETFNFFWVGFYMIKGNELILGPFQGSVACYRIKKGRGVCGTAWTEEKTQIVPNVDLFPGHIACSSLSRSEIVVPITSNGKIKGVLDIDSDELNTFDDTDRIYLEEIINILSSNIY